MGFLIFIGVCVLVLIIDSALVVFVHRRVMGDFCVKSDWHRMLKISSCGRDFTIRRDIKSFHYLGGDVQGAVNFDDLSAIEIRVEKGASYLGDVLLDLELSKSIFDEADYINWYTVSLICADGRSIPVFKSGKYHRRRYLHDLYTDIQLFFLEHLGLVIEVEAQCAKITEILQTELSIPESKVWRIDAL